MKKRSAPSGFTLIELLVVIAIIAILAALVLAVAGIVQQKGARARAQAEIQAMSAGLESYKADNGDYPPGNMTSPTVAVSGSANVLYIALSGVSNTKVYVEFNKNQTNSTGTLVDPFGNFYCYQYPGLATRSGTNFFDLWSIANNSTNTNVWIVNW